MAELTRSQGMLDGALGRLLVTVEAYPELKASQNMMQLSEELTSTENKVAFARQAFNDSVMAYNNKREVFPSSIVAGMFNFAAAALLEIPEDQQAAVRAAPKVQFCSSAGELLRTPGCGQARIDAPGRVVRAGGDRDSGRGQSRGVGGLRRRAGYHRGRHQHGRRVGGGRTGDRGGPRHGLAVPPSTVAGR